MVVQDAASSPSRHRSNLELLAKDARWWLLPVLATTAFVARFLWVGGMSGDPFWAAFHDLLVLGPLGLAAFVLWIVCVVKVSEVAQLVASIVCGAMIVSSLTVAGFGMPVRVGFAGSRSAFDAVVAEADAKLPARPVDARWLQQVDFPISCPRAIGDIRIASCQAFWTSKTHGYTFIRAWGYPVGDDLGIAGIDYRPDARTTGALNDHLVGQRLTHLGGPWFNWSMPD